jgi:hypothetical protein
MSLNRHGLYTPEGGAADPVFRIGLAPLPVEHWFEGGEPDPAVRKDALLASVSHLVWGESEGSRPAQAEVAGMIGDWLDHPAPFADPSLWTASRAVADDLCLMEKRGGEWTLTAASLCAPSFFSADEVVGRPLAGLHAPVPGFNDGLLHRVARIFDHLQHDQLVERRNWTVVNSPDLHQPDPAPYRARLAGQSLEEIAASLHVRRERQTLRRAPETGAVLFTIRIWTERLDDLLADPQRRAGFAQAWARLMADEGAPFRTYKRLDLYDAAVQSRLTSFPR